MPYPVGSRVLPKTEFRLRLPYQAGTVVGRGRASKTVRVLWDGFKTPQTLPFEYLAPAENDAELKPSS
jgi:hypothetical protein